MYKDIEAQFIKDKYVLLKDMHVYTDYFGKRQYFIIPKGFKTDFASVPRIFWSFISPTDEFIRVPSLIHDYMYRTHMYSRKIADSIFLEKMLSFDKKIIIKAYITFIVVRIAGFYAYNKKTNE